MNAAAHLVSLETCVPIVNFFDGFRTSHGYHKIELLDQEDVRPLVMEKIISDNTDKYSPIYFSTFRQSDDL